MMKENISALVDGELDDVESERCISAIRQDRDARDCWETCHLIGDVLRGHVSPGFADRVRERLSEEPTLLAPRRRAWDTAQVFRLAMSAVASVSAVALVSWLVFTGGAPEQEAARGVVAAQTRPVVSVPEQPVADYLLAHQRFSSSSAMQGVAPFVRTVASPGGEDQ